MPIKKKDKSEREQQVLFGLIELYLEEGKPVGSVTLQETLFPDLSSATIRNYFAKLENEGFLSQQHSSGGREPTELAYRHYLQHIFDDEFLDEEDAARLAPLKEQDPRDLSRFLTSAAERLSETLGLPVFLSAPRFDQDVISDIKVIAIDHKRCLCVMITDFGLVHTEVLPIEATQSLFSPQRVEEYFHARLQGRECPSQMSREEREIAHRLYSEVMVRYLVNYSHFTHDDLHRTGLSRLLTYPEFKDPLALTYGLALFEDTEKMRHLLRSCTKENKIKSWIGGQLQGSGPLLPLCSALAIPYYTGAHAVGAIGVLGGMRQPYRRLLGTLRLFSSLISTVLTQALAKHKLSYRKPQDLEASLLDKGSQGLIAPTLLEDLPYHDPLA